MGDRRGVSGRSARERLRRRRASYWVLRTGCVPLSLPPPPGPVSSPRCHRLGLTRREGSQRSASEASGEAGNSAAPARRPAPSPGPAPRWKAAVAAVAAAGQRFGGGEWGESLSRSLSPPGSSRAPRPRALQGSCRWARSGGSGGWGGIGAGCAGLGIPECWTLSCLPLGSTPQLLSYHCPGGGTE